MTATPTTDAPTWEQLIDSIAQGAKHPEETCWAIFRYMRQNLGSMGSKMARTLLSAYIKLQPKKPSLINSCMLAMALKVSEEYADFHLPKFIKAWGYASLLRDEDRQRQQGKDGRTYPALTERVERALQVYMLRHPKKPSSGETPAESRPADTKVGYVDGIDEGRGYVHIYDSMSRHYVAKGAQSMVSAVRRGCFISFCPIGMPGDSFKSAVIMGTIDKYKGREAFGTYAARITYVNTKDCYIRYAITSGIMSAEGGTISKEGFASTAAMPESTRCQLKVGQTVHLTLFLKRGKDGTKRNHVAEVF
jgi:hypothetical protein